MIISKYYPITKPWYQILKLDYFRRVMTTEVKNFCVCGSRDQVLNSIFLGSSIDHHTLGIKYWSPYYWDQVLISIFFGSSIDHHILGIKYWSPYSWDQVLISIFLGSSIDLHILGINNNPHRSSDICSMI